MLFRYAYYFLIMFVIATGTSCEKDEPIEHLPGIWTLSDVVVNGQEGSGQGTISFSEDLTGSMAITYMGDGIQITRGGSFMYEATKNEIAFTDLTQNEFTWERVRNRSDEQQFEFTDNVIGEDFNIRLTFTK